MFKEAENQQLTGKTNEHSFNKLKYARGTLKTLQSLLQSIEELSY